eukprot:scaffold8675_cov22-Tisochrysis_lutea.AAC.2
MTKDDLIKNLGTIAKSGTSEGSYKGSCGQLALDLTGESPQIWNLWNELVLTSSSVLLIGAPQGRSLHLINPALFVLKGLVHVCGLASTASHQHECANELSVAPHSGRYVWQSTADGHFSIAEDDGEDIGRGTVINIHLKPEAQEYSEDILEQLAPTLSRGGVATCAFVEIHMISP